jgi:hypothetical protein
MVFINQDTKQGNTDTNMYFKSVQFSGISFCIINTVTELFNVIIQILRESIYFAKDLDHSFKKPCRNRLTD